MVVLICSRHKLICSYSAVFLPMVARLLYFRHVCDGFDTRIILDIGKPTRVWLKINQLLSSSTYLTHPKVAARLQEPITERGQFSKT